MFEKKADASKEVSELKSQLQTLSFRVSDLEHGKPQRVSIAVAQPGGVVLVISDVEKPTAQALVALGVAQYHIAPQPQLPALPHFRVAALPSGRKALARTFGNTTQYFDGPDDAIRATPGWESCPEEICEQWKAVKPDDRAGMRQGVPGITKPSASLPKPVA